MLAWIWRTNVSNASISPSVNRRSRSISFSTFYYAVWGYRLHAFFVPRGSMERVGNFRISNSEVGRSGCRPNGLVRFWRSECMASFRHYERGASTHNVVQSSDRLWRRDAPVLRRPTQTPSLEESFRLRE